MGVADWFVGWAELNFDLCEYQRVVWRWWTVVAPQWHPVVAVGSEWGTVGGRGVAEPARQLLE